MSFTKVAQVRITGGLPESSPRIEVNGEQMPYVTKVTLVADAGNGPVCARLDVIGSVEFDGVAEVEIVSELAWARLQIERLEASLAACQMALSRSPWNRDELLEAFTSADSLLRNNRHVQVLKV